MGEIYSYRLLIGYTDGLVKKVKNYTANGEFGFVSQTTSRHVHLVQNYIMMAEHNPLESLEV